MNHTIFRVEKLKTQGDVREQARHILRVGSMPDHVNPAGDWHHVAGAPRVDQTIAALGQRMAAATGVIRSTTVRGIDVLMTLTPEAFARDGEDYERANPDTWSKDTIARFQRAALDYLRDEFGSENVLTAALHLDESSPHLQAVVAPVTPDGRYTAKHWTGGSAAMSALQDRYHAHMAAAMPDLDLSRGKRGSRAKHSRIKDYHRAAAQPVPELEPLPTPPMMARQATRVAWAEEQTAAYRAQLQQLTDKAAALEAERDKAQKEAESHRLAELKIKRTNGKFADWLRDLFRRTVFNGDPVTEEDFTEPAFQPFLAQEWADLDEHERATAEAHEAAAMDMARTPGRAGRDRKHDSDPSL